MTNAEIIRNMSNEGLAMFIRTVYLAGRDGDGFAMFNYNFEEWLKKETDRSPYYDCQEDKIGHDNMCKKEVG